MKIYRASDPDPIELADVKIDKSTVFTQQLMGEHRVDANWISPAVLDLTLGDYIVIGAEKLYLNRPVNYQKVNDFTHRYSASFEGEVYELYRLILRDEGSKRFSYFGDPEEFMLLVLENMNAEHPGWTLNIDLPVTYEPLELSFDGDSCRVAMTKIMEAFKLEFRLVQREIIVRQDVGFDSIYSFQYGRHNGMYSLIRESRDDSEVITRLYGYGGDKNLPSSYRGGANELMFEVEGKNYIEANVELYGVREGTVTFPEIFPRRTGAITAVQTNKVVRDSTIDFDLNAHLIGGVVAKIVFKSGALSGYEFDIEKYDHATKEITFIPRDEANGAVIPDTGSFQPEVGDTYTLVNINMPDTYKTAAEAELLAATQEHHIKTKSPQVAYGLPLDEKYVRDNGIALSCGMRVGVADTDLGLDETIRIYAISFPPVNPAELTVQIADTIPYRADERIKKDIKVIKNQTTVIDRERAENYRESMWRLRQLQTKIYDPDGYFDPVNIKPSTIETQMLSVGARSQNFVLNEVEIAPNYLGNPNNILISSGDLIHFEIDIPGLGYIWEMDTNNIEGLDPEKYYYVYARCNRSALTGTWVISEAPLATESEVGFYHFWLGILYPVKNGIRFFQFTKGMTYIVGDTITTGKIQSADGTVSFGLTDGNLNIGLEADKGMDFNVSSPGNLTIRGAIMVNAIFADDGVIQNLRVNQLRTADSGKRMEIRAFEDPEQTIPAHYQKFYDADGNVVLTIDTEVDSDQSGAPKAGIRVNTADNSRTALITGNGMFSNAGQYRAFAVSSGLPDTNGSVVGLVFDRNADPEGISAGVIGVDGTTSGTAGNSKTFGGFFTSIMIWCLNLFCRSISAHYTIGAWDVLISCYNTTQITVKLPASPKKGRIVFIRRNNTADLWVDGNGIQMMAPGLVNDVRMGSDSGRGNLIVCFYDGSYWTFNRFGM